MEQQGQISRCSRCSITSGVIGGISITRWRNGSGSSPCNKVPQWRQASGWCSTTSFTRSIGSSFGPDPGWPGWPPRLRPLPLRCAGGLNPGPSLEGGLEELRELRPICSRRLASSVARAVSLLRSCSISCCWARMNCLASGGHDSQSASGIPAGGVLITDGLCLRCNRESSCSQEFSSVSARDEPSRPLNR